MATNQTNAGSMEAAILSRMIHPAKADLPGDAAKALLGVKFDQSDLDRMHELAVKHQDDALTPAEKAELESYLRVSYFIDLIHAKARLSLKKHHQATHGMDAALERLVRQRAEGRCEYCHPPQAGTQVPFLRVADCTGYRL